jgi:phosphatidylglycerol:prolipoprotein diacylglycerol transferase
MLAQLTMLTNWNAVTALRFLSNVDPGILWGASLLAALLFTLRTARREGLDPRAMYWAGTSAILFGLWGGYLLGFVYYGADGRPWAWLRFWSGGRAEYGALLAGMLATAIYLRIRKLPFLRYADAIVPAVALGAAIGRLGCFLNGDDFGTRSTLPWAVIFPPGTEAYADHFNRGWIVSSDPLSLPVHPVQLYASLFALTLFVFLAWWRPSRTGLRFAGFLVIYGAGRFADQHFRGDFQPILGPFSLTQLISLLLVTAGAVIWVGATGVTRGAANVSMVALPATMANK